MGGFSIMSPAPPLFQEPASATRLKSLKKGVKSRIINSLLTSFVRSVTRKYLIYRCFFRTENIPLSLGLYDQ